MGMTPGEYWNGDCELVKYYRKADWIRKRERNAELWLQGMYVYEAILDLAPILRAFVKNPKPEPYSKEPYPMTDKEKREREERDAARQAEETREKLRQQMLAINKSRVEK